MGNQIDVVIQPVVLRFTLLDDEVVYFFAADTEAVLDEMELMMGINPEKDMLFDSNLGFLPVSTTVLIRGEKNILVDPGNTHTGFYGQLAIGLRRFGLTPGHIDLVVCTHCHHDHMGSAVSIPGVDIVLGEGEADFCEELYGAADTEARLAVMGRLIEVGRGEELELMPGVVAISTPGHTPGHISVMAENQDGERVVVAGDTVMTRREYTDRTFSHWYTSGQLRELHSSLDRLQALRPSTVMPGHDRAFAPRES
ncbi:MAG: MBL fold metallo-hydrolase [Acidimicrobiia bacterium]|nr:MBL fold metallo-hydrolase [Acidimicrobiia bacterium]